MPALILHDGKRIGIAESDSSGLGVLAWFHHNVHAYSMDHATRHEGYAVEEVDSVDCGEVESLIAAIAERVGLSMSATFVPFSQSRNAKPGKDGKVWRSLNWRVTFKRSNGRDVLETDYAQGEGYSPASKARFQGGKASGFYEAKLRDAAIAHEIETGRIHLFGEGVLFGGDGTRDTRKPVPAPSIGDVLQSLARDCDVLDAGPFEEWARDLGYDADSRAAEGIYRACLDIATRLRAGIGEHALAELRLAASFN